MPARRAIFALRRGFTLIELLVTISIIGVLLGLLFPALGLVKETAKRTACRANLRSIGIGFEVYRNRNEDLLPRALPLEDSTSTDSEGNPAPLGPDSILAILAPLVDSAEVFICPSDDEIPLFLYEQPTGPVGNHSSYEYWAGSLMLAREIFAADPNPEKSVTMFYEAEPEFPVMADSLARHPDTGEFDKNALFFGDWRSDEMLVDPREEAENTPPDIPTGPAT